MLLKKVRVTNFKCVEDSGWWRVGPVACLVGKNESGKTALLQALYRLNPYAREEAKFDRVNEYPRRYLTEYDKRHGGEDADAIETEWTLQDSDIEELNKELGAGAVRSGEVTIAKGYDNRRKWGINVDEQAVVNHLMKQAEFDKAEREAASKCTNVEELRSHIKELNKNATERQKALAAEIEKRFKEKDATSRAIEILEEKLPKFLYFSQYNKMPGQVSLEEVTRKQAENRLTDDDRVFLAFLGLVGTNLKQLAEQTSFEPLIARLEAASNKISDEIFHYWSQNRHLKIQVRVDAGRPGDPSPFNTGWIMRIRIENLRHNVTVRFDDRSTGFVWFFSFLVLFSQVKKTHGDNLIILLDEPGLSLHAKAQADLLRYINEKLRPHHQVVYTTHSPFMVDVDNLLGTRTVEDLVSKDGLGVDLVFGTKVGDDILSTDRDTLFPLQGALGYDITQSLFVGKHTLLVEGPSDLLYLKTMQYELGKRKRATLDHRWTICPSGGVDKVAAFVSLFGGNKLDIAVLIDYVHGKKGQVERLRQSKLLLDGHVLTADSYSGQPEADIEDIIGARTYKELVNLCYGLKPEHRIQRQDQKDISMRVLKEVEDHFKSLPTGTPAFDHFEPAMFLMENREKLFVELPGVEDALSRFESLFADLNKLLPEV